MELFFGYKQSIVKFVDESEEQEIMKRKEIMGPLMLDIDQKTLYDALDEAFLSEIPDYHGPSPKRAEVQRGTHYREGWILNCPKVLMLALNRVQYDSIQGKPFKKNDKFEFEKMIYMDRYLYQNKSKSQEIQRSMK